MKESRPVQKLEFEADKKELKGQRSWRVTLDDTHNVEHTEIKSKIEVTNSMLSQEKTIAFINKAMSYIRDLFDEEVKKYQFMYQDFEKQEGESAK